MPNHTAPAKPITRRVLNAATDEAMAKMDPETLDAIFAGGDKDAEETMYAEVRAILTAKGYDASGLKA